MSSAPNNDSNNNNNKEQRLKQALSQLLQSNFDADTKVCVMTLLKVLDNVLQQPSNPKVRSIRMGNPAFSQKVVQRPGGVEFLLACGFEQQTTPPPVLSRGDAVGEAHLVLSPQHEDTSLLILARRLLAQTATLELHVKADELPKYKPPPPPPAAATTSRPSSSSSSSSSSFDVYRGHRFDAKSAALGQQLGPDETYVSKTETQLSRLQKQQEKLEQRMQRPLVDRQLSVTLPSNKKKNNIFSNEPSDGSSSSDINRGTSTTDGALLKQRLMKQEQERLEREKQGFTTKAMRDLKHMKKAKVYSHVQLRVQFPDGSILTGKFLPKETVGTVKRVILEQCLLLKDLRLDLYVAPPRRKLEETKTLQEEGLVPAARVIGSWLVGHAPPSDVPPGSFWNPDLVVVGGSGGDDSMAAEAATLYPVSKALVDDESKAAASSSSTGGGDATGASREDEMLKRMMGGQKGLGGGGTGKGSAAGSKKSTGKPKWFKG